MCAVRWWLLVRIQGKRWGWVLWLAALAAFGSGCQTVGFYAQAIRGQYQILTHQVPINRLISDPQTRARLKGQLELVLRLRQFARDELKLPVDHLYLKYVDLHRPYVVWNVQAAPRFSLQPKTWWYPLVGRLAYRGYFTRRGARRYAKRLEARHYDVYTDGVQAYSTLGWFTDPVLNTFIHRSEPELAELLFHELAHHRLFVPGDTDFNEAFATTVGEEGARRWLRFENKTNLYRRYVQLLQRNAQFVTLIMNTRARLMSIYGDTRNKNGEVQAARRPPAPPGQLRREKRRVLADLRREYAQLKSQWNGYSGFDGWFAGKVNNARLDSVATYFDYLPGFKELLHRENGNLESFYKAVARLAKLPQRKRHQRLRTLAKQALLRRPKERKLQQSRKRASEP